MPSTNQRDSREYEFLGIVIVLCVFIGLFRHLRIYTSLTIYLGRKLEHKVIPPFSTDAQLALPRPATTEFAQSRLFTHHLGFDSTLRNPLKLSQTYVAADYATRDTIRLVDHLDSKKKRFITEIDKINEYYFNNEPTVLSSSQVSSPPKHPLHMYFSLHPLLIFYRRETFKVGLIYVGFGQEDEKAIFKNEKGSALYNEFAHGMADVLNLKGHAGYGGSLEKHTSVGSTLLYYARPILEVAFHETVRMPTTQKKVSFLLLECFRCSTI